VHVELLHGKAVLRVVTRTGLKRDGIGEMAARRVENGSLGLCERGQASDEVVFGEGNEGTA
jgi:hypothetical protein